MKRKLITDMAAWKEEGSLKPLLISGIKGTGKTYLALEFAKSYYEGSIYINFENSKAIWNEFSGDMGKRDFFEIMSSYYQVPMQLFGNILVILDEIKRFQPAYDSFVNFCIENEDVPLNIIVLTSDAPSSNDKSIFKHFTLKPLDFEEFLIANGNEWYTDIIKAHSQNLKKVPEIVHNELSSLFEDYLMVGGMPAAVNEYLQLETVDNVNEIHKLLLNNIMADLGKVYDESAAFKCRQILDVIVPQLIKNNKKFQYTLIRKGATYNMFKDAITALVADGHVIKCGKISDETEDSQIFKLYLWDTGVLNTLLHSSACAGAEMDEESLKKILLENYVTNTLKQIGMDTYFWESDSAARVECVIKRNDRFIPIDIRIRENIRSKSAGIFKNTFDSPYILRITSRNFEVTEEAHYIPYYALYALNL